MPILSHTVENFSINPAHSREATFREIWEAIFKDTHLNTVILNLFFYLIKVKLLWVLILFSHILVPHARRI